MSSSEKGPNGPDETDATWIEPQKPEALRPRAGTRMGIGEPGVVMARAPVPTRADRAKTLVGMATAPDGTRVVGVTDGATVIDEPRAPIRPQDITPDFLSNNQELVFCILNGGFYLALVDIPASYRYLALLEQSPKVTIRGIESALSIGVYVGGTKYMVPVIRVKEDRLKVDHTSADAISWLVKVQMNKTSGKDTRGRLAETLLDPGGREETVMEPNAGAVAPLLPTSDNLHGHPDMLLCKDHTGVFFLALLNTRAFVYGPCLTYIGTERFLAVRVAGDPHLLPVKLGDQDVLNSLDRVPVTEWLASFDTRNVIVAEDATVPSAAPVPARVQADEVALYSTAWDTVGPDGTYVNVARLANALPPPVYTPAVPQPDVDGTQVGGRSGHFASVPYAAPTVDTVQDDARFAEAEATRNQRIIIGGIVAFLVVAGAVVTIRSCGAKDARPVESTPPATSVTPR